MNTSNNNTFVPVPGSDKPAVVLTPKFSGQLAVVDLGVIQRLASFLPEAHFGTIRRDLVAQIERADNLPAMLDIIEDELAFHKSINLITEYKPGSEPDRIEKYANH